MKKFFNKLDKTYFAVFALWLTATIIWGRIDSLSLLAFFSGVAFILWQGLRNKL